MRREGGPDECVRGYGIGPVGFGPRDPADSWMAKKRLDAEFFRKRRLLAMNQSTANRWLRIGPCQRNIKFKGTLLTS